MSNKYPIVMMTSRNQQAEISNNQALPPPPLKHWGWKMSFILLARSPSTGATVDGSEILYKTLQVVGINYPPQLVSWISDPSTVC